MYLPRPLKYSYDALEPYIDSETVYLHYNKHYLGYLNKLNNLLNSLDFKYQYSVEELITRIEEFPLDKRDDILFLAGGVLNHENYFDSMGKTKLNQASPIFKAIEKRYGSYDLFKQEFVKCANTLVGSGYTSLVMLEDNTLEIINTSNQETPLLYGLKPIMMLDLWEHAYYLKYRNQKDLYIDAFFHIIDFDVLSQRYEEKEKEVK